MSAPRATFIEKLMLQGELSSLVGLLVYLLCLPKSPYDVVEETRMRLQYLEEEVHKFRFLLFSAQEISAYSSF